MRRGDAEGGVTLPEVLVASALGLLVMLAVASSTRMALSAYGQGDRQAPEIRRAAIALDFLARDLATCEAVYSPHAGRLVMGHPVGEGMLWASRNGAGEPVWVAYAAVDREKVVRCEYGQDPLGSPAPAPTDTVRLPPGASGVRVSRLMGRPRLLQLSAADEHAEPLGTWTTVKGLAPEEEGR